MLSMVDVSTRAHHLSTSSSRVDLPQRRLRRRGPALILLALILAVGAWAALLPNKQAEHTVSIVGGFAASPDGRSLRLSVSAGCLGEASETRVDPPRQLVEPIGRGSTSDPGSVYPTRTDDEPPGGEGDEP